MPDPTQKPPGRSDRRQARLEQALRENLKKRKDLARKRSVDGPQVGKPGHSGRPEAPPED